MSTYAASTREGRWSAPRAGAPSERRSMRRCFPTSTSTSAGSVSTGSRSIRRSPAIATSCSASTGARTSPAAGAQVPLAARPDRRARPSRRRPPMLRSTRCPTEQARHGPADPGAGQRLRRQPRRSHPAAERFGNGKGSWANWNGARGGDARRQGLCRRRHRPPATAPLPSPARSQPGPMMAAGPPPRLLDPSVQLEPGPRPSPSPRRHQAAAELADRRRRRDGLIDLGRQRVRQSQGRGAAEPPGRGAAQPHRRPRRAAGDGAERRLPHAGRRLRSARAALGFNGTIVEGLQARGRARVNTDRIDDPGPVRPCPAADHRPQPRLRRPANQRRAQTARSRSGRASLSDDCASVPTSQRHRDPRRRPRPRAPTRRGIQGRVNNFLVQGIGLLDIDDPHGRAHRRQGLRHTRQGRALQTRRIDNASARGVLEGNATATRQCRLWIRTAWSTSPTCG